MAIDAGAVGLIINGVSSLASTAVGAYNSWANKSANDKNLKLQQQTLNFQKEQQDYNRAMSERDFNYNRDLQERIFQREDNAVQRMVADNRAAGLSPIAGLAGAGTGQALESNTPQLNQTFDTPQMSANQLLVDFSSLGQLGSQITNYELNKDNLKLAQEKLDLEKSSNEANLKQMEANLKATELKNTFDKATMESRIESSKLAPQKVQKEIAKASYDIVSASIGSELRELEKIQTKREMEEWMENKGLRADLGNLDLEKAKVDLALKELLKEQNIEKFGPSLDILNEQLESLRRENQRELSWDSTLADLGLDSGKGRLAGNVLNKLFQLLK